MTASTVDLHVRGAGALLPVVEEALAEIRPVARAAVVVPAVPEPAPLAELTDERLAADVGDGLDAVLADVQAVLDGLHRLVFVLPATPLMGVPGGAGASAVANGVLSMARTLAIELARDEVTVNVLAVSDPAGLGPQLGALLGEGGEAVTGQEIYLSGGADLGRLRP
jgi:NAD(P)-dependent dehydrogenase (short-subunit alcohol dehydrogenase family)